MPIPSKYLTPAASGLVCFALGWLVKPAPAPPANTTVAPATAKSSHVTNEGSGSSSHDRLVMPQHNGGNRPPNDPDAKKPDVNRSWLGVVNAAEKSRLLRYSEALGLDPTQEQQMADIRKKERSAFHDLARNGKSPADMLDDAAAAEKEADAALKNVLDPDQLAGLEAYKARQKENDIESKAQSVLSDVLSNADLSAEQRERALTILRSASQKEVEAQPPGWDLIAENYSILGVKNSGYIDNIGSVLTADGPTDPAAMMQRMQEAQRKTIANREALLGSVLTPAQLAQYRTTLEGRLNLSQAAPQPQNPHR